MISLIIPIYNEANHLEKFLQHIDALELPIEKELIFIDDCSSDASFQILSDFKFESKNQVLRQDRNCGKGAALRRGFVEATGEIICVQDADFEYKPDDINFLVKPLISNEADIVYGSRFSKNNRQVHRTFHYLVNRFLTLLSNLCSGLFLSDMETCYKIFKADIIKNINLESNAFGFEPEVTAKLGKLKIRVMEFPISYFPRNYIEGKKISWKDGVAAVWHILYFNFLVNFEKSFKKSLPKEYIATDSNLL